MINDYGIDFVIKYDVPQNKLLILGAAMDFLKDGQISSFCLDQPEGQLFTLRMLHKHTQSLENFKKIPF